MQSKSKLQEGILKYFLRPQQTDFKITGKCKGLQVAKIILESLAGGLILPDFKVYYKAADIKTMWHWCQDRHIRSMEQAGGVQKWTHTYKANGN